MAYSVQRAVSDGTLSTITLDIDFFAKEHISVLVADRILPNADYTFSWIGSNTIKIVPNVEKGAEVLIRRTTPYGECFHNFRLGAVFKDETMDENFKQVLFLTQEAIEGQTSTDFYTDLNFHGYKLRNIGPAVAAFDAIPYSQYQGDALGAYQSRLAADASRVAAGNSQTLAKASEVAAAASASSAAGSASTAGTQASAASASATTASQKAAEASTSAASASSSASAAAGSLASVNASATAALNSQNAAKASETAAAASASTASTKASDVATSATAAAASATAANSSATAASTSATNANASKVAAKTSEDNAKASENAAANSASNAATSANEAKSWAQIAKGASIPDGVITPSKLSPEVNAKFVDAAGDTMTGPLVLNNNVQLQSKDSGGNVKPVLYLGVGGNLNIVNGPAGATQFVKSDTSSIVAYVDDNGNINATGDIVTNKSVRLPAGGTLFGKNNAGNAYQMVRSDGSNTDIVNGNGTKVRVINQAYNAELVTVDNSGNTSIAGNLTVQGKNVVRSVNGATADANGNVTINVSGFVPVDCGYNNVGSLCFCLYSNSISAGSTTAGVNIKPSMGAGTHAGAALSGTWRCLGALNSSGGATLFQRIA